jgi:capsular polysaccharide biosynthesis protein
MQIQATLQQCARVVRQKGVFILAGISVCTSLTYVVSMRFPATYEATSLVQIHTVSIGGNSDVFKAQQLTTNDALLVTSPDILQEANQKLSGITLPQLTQAIHAEAMPGSQLIAIHAYAPTIQQATGIANQVAKAFIKVQQTRESAFLQAELDQLSQQIKTTKQDLTLAQQHLVKLQNEDAQDTEIMRQDSICDTDQSNYNQLLTSYGQVQVQKLQASTMFDIAQIANTADNLNHPDLLLNTLLAASVSTGIFIGLALFIHSLFIHSLFIHRLNATNTPRNMITPPISLDTEDPDQSREHQETPIPFLKKDELPPFQLYTLRPRLSLPMTHAGTAMLYNHSIAQRQSSSDAKFETPQALPILKTPPTEDTEEAMPLESKYQFKTPLYKLHNPIQNPDPLT